MIDFLRYRYIAAILSAVLVTGFVGTYIKRTLEHGSAFEYSVDFTGGTQVHLAMDKAVDKQQLRSVIEKSWPGSSIRDFSNNEILVRVKSFSVDSQGLAARLQGRIEKQFTGTQVTIKELSSVSSDIGATLRSKSIFVVLLALLLMLLYIMMRFWSFSYGAGAVIALLHDALAMLTFCLIFNVEISAAVISAILTVMGYSINDTIVIFSNIRDRLNRPDVSDRNEAVNRGINGTLRRTLLTTITTALGVLSLMIFGGNALRDLSTVLMVGIIFGTYSSIMIASPVMLSLMGRTKKVRS
jgi:preprotein translocase subunit SecF